MKTIIIIMWIICSSWVNCGAQELTLKSGYMLNSSTAKKVVGFEFKPENTITWGIGLNINLSNHISLKSELNFENKKLALNKQVEGGLTGFYDIASSSLKQELSYWSIPLLLQYNFGKKKMFFINSGITYSILKSAEQTGGIVYRVFDSQKPLDLSSGLSSNYKSRDVSWSFGGGIYLEATDLIGVTFETRYNLGLVDTTIPDSYYFSFYETQEMKNRSLVFTLGLTINLKNKKTEEK